MASRPPLETWVLRALTPATADSEVVAGAQAARRSLAARAARALAALDARAIPRGDPEYPAGVLELPDPPPVMFARGDALPSAVRAVALVGARAASPYGLAVASRLARDLSRLGMVVVSGLARGIDAAAHRGSLEAGGRTVAVLPSGLDCVTPRHHRGLADAIAAQGALVTELPCGGPRFRGEFVRRNRLIAALAAATVVVEAAAESGALTTAAVARRLGRAVLAVPGDADRPTARGAHALLRGGARLCEDAGDVAAAVAQWQARAGLSMTGSEAVGSAAAGAPDAAAGTEERLLAALAGGPGALEAVAAAAGLALPEALAGLLALQWAGVVMAMPGQRWARRTR